LGGRHQNSFSPGKHTPSHTNKSVDKPDGLAHNKSISGREALPLCSQLGIGYPRPMDLTGYLLELTQTPHQVRQTQEISCSQEEQIKISQEVGELLAKVP